MARDGTKMEIQEGTPSYSQLDIAPTVASILGLQLPNSDGRPIDQVAEWGCKNVALIIIDSLGYDLMKWLLPHLPNISVLMEEGMLLSAEAVSNHTTPAIASILSGLLPEHHKIMDKAGAKESSILSLPELASAAGLKSAVIMESNGAQVYSGLIEIANGIPDTIPPEEFDRQACRMTMEALLQRPRLLVSYFIGIDKSVHLGRGAKEIRTAAMLIDLCIGKILRAADPETLFILCGDHPIHAGLLKRDKGPYAVALILGKVRAKGAS
ncbi:Type I phosphodiesterase / nucleotide pyrophosphatase [uncultured archaeon]|nr:Type I phosphodiesterase / nucleotide pyrophosphatase [uncultured archaeon]